MCNLKRQYMNSPDFDKTIRQLIEKETEIVNQRTNWCMALQTVLLTAFWYVSESDEPHKDPYLLVIISVGIIYSLSTIYSIWSNERAIAFILSKWNDYIHIRNEEYDDFPPGWAGSKEAINNTFGLDNGLKKKIYKKIMFKCGFMSMYSLQPILFLLVWIAVGLIYFFWPVSNAIA